MRPTKVLFVCKQRGEPYHGHSPDTKEWKNRSFTGLNNSVRYVVDMLRHIGIEAAWQTVADNNAIDRAVAQYKPTHAIIEALWVVPQKFDVLQRHPGVKWNVRLHSEIPFLSMEGPAMEWIFGYLKRGVSVSANSIRAQAALAAVSGKPIPYTPNYYPLYPLEPRKGLPADECIDIGCFGAIRPLKNQLTQAVAAIEFANALGRKMRFHLNADRVEGGGLPILHNIQALFASSPHDLVEHGWMDTPAFIATARNMDLGLQVSFSETFNIVSADLATANVPLVVSPEVIWAAPVFQADPTDLPNIVNTMRIAWCGRSIDLHRQNYEGLENYDAASEQAWPLALQAMGK
jgi:hypothetical protein